MHAGGGGHGTACAAAGRRHRGHRQCPHGAVETVGNRPWRRAAAGAGCRPAGGAGRGPGSEIVAFGKRSVLHHQRQRPRRHPGGGRGRQCLGRLGKRSEFHEEENVRPRRDLAGRCWSCGRRRRRRCTSAKAFCRPVGPASGSWWRRRFGSGDCTPSNRRRAADPSYATLVALVGSAIFVISCMHVPLPGGTCSHPCGTGLGALLIGPGPTVVVASIALLLASAVPGPWRLDHAGGQYHVDGRGRGLQRLLLVPRACGGRGCRLSPPRFSPACSRIGPPTPWRPWNWPAGRTATSR